MIDQALEPLPTLVHVDEAFSQRLPSQRVIDALERAEPNTPIGELVSRMPFRLTAFRALLRDYPERDPTSLWMHAYDVEVQIGETDPTGGNGLTVSPPSAVTGG